MKKFKRIMKLLALICLIALAVMGVGLSGGVPIPLSNKREDTIEANIELVESEKDEVSLEEVVLT